MNATAPDNPAGVFESVRKRNGDEECREYDGKASSPMLADTVHEGDAQMTLTCE